VDNMFAYDILLLLLFNYTPIPLFFFSLIQQTRKSQFFPYTTLFRSLTNLGIPFTNVTRDNLIIEQVLAGEPSITGIFSASQLERSEEHTSELQSRFDLVCRLLLEKKKK